MEYTPYRYILRDPDDPKDGHQLIIASRSQSGERRRFTFPVYPIAIVKMGECTAALTNLKESLGTSHIRYEPRIEAFVVRDDIKINSKDFIEVSHVPLTVSTALWDAGHTFFDQIMTTGERLHTRSESYPFITMNWTIQVTSEGTIGWISYIQTDQSEPQILTSVGTSPLGETVIIERFLSDISEVDIETGDPYDWDVLLRRARIVGAKLPRDSRIIANGSNLVFDMITLEHVDLLSFTQKAFPHLSFRTIDELYTELFELSPSPHPHEIEDFLSVATLRIRAVYETVEPHLLEISLLSGSNLGDLTRDDLFRDILRSYSYDLSTSSIVKSRIPKPFTSLGKFKRPHGYLLGTYLHSLLSRSYDDKTKQIASWASSIKEYSWIMRSIFCLEPLVVSDFDEGFIAFHNEVLYTTLKLHKIDPITEWSLLVCPAKGDLIRVTLTKESEVILSYHGNTPFCNHPYPALRDAVKLYMTCVINGSELAPDVIAKAVSLDSDSTAFTQTVSFRNVDRYHSHLTDTENRIVKEGGNVKIRLWKNENGLTREHGRFYRPGYIDDMSTYLETLSRM